MSSRSARTVRDSGPGSGLRVLVVTNMWPSADDPVFGSFVARSVRAMRAAGAQVRVVANTNSRTGGAAAAAKYALLYVRALWAAAVSRGRIDAVVGHYLYPTAAIARTVARVARAPLVLVAHGTDTRSVRRDDFFGKAGRAALADADLVVTVSHALERVVRDELHVPASVPVEVVNMGYDDAIFRPNPQAREKLRLDPAERIVLYVGNLVETKGVDVLVDAFIRVLDEGHADRLVLVGDGPLRRYAESAVEQAAASYEHADPTERVVMTGRLEQSDVALWMAAADVFVLPSRNEGLGLVLFEAMACGTPCVGTTVGGIPEVLDQSCGSLVPPEDDAALANGIESVLASGKDSYRDACLVCASEHSSSVKAIELIEAIKRVVSDAESQD